MSWFRSDRELAVTKYAGRESASAKAARKEARWPKPARNAREADRAGSRFATNDHCAAGFRHEGRCKHRNT